MKISYKYVDKWFTMIRLSDDSTRKTKVKHWQVVESDRDPNCFLYSWFVSESISNRKDRDNLSKIVEAEKTINKSEKNLSKKTKQTLDLSKMSKKDMLSKLKEMWLKVHPNTWEKKLREKLKANLKG